jgi:hypothetical protein
MNESSPRPPSDAEINDLLAARLRRTSPEFEQRWRELRGGFGSPRPARRPLAVRWLLWTGFGAAAAAALGLALLPPRPATSTSPATAAVIEELFTLDEALKPALALLDSENREALLHLSPNSQL